MAIFTLLKSEVAFLSFLSFRVSTAVWLLGRDEESA